MKVALVYDRVNKWGGAERVLLALHKIFPNAPLYTSVYNPETALWAKDFTIRTSFLQRVPFIRSHHQLFPFLMPLAFEEFVFDEYDLVISVTSEAAKGIITKPFTRHLCLCLTPTRYLWSGYEEYFNSKILQFFASPILWYLRVWDRIAAQRPDKLIAISHEVKRRIKEYYHLESTVIYPLLMTETVKTAEKSNTSEGEYFLVVSRLSRFTSYKRVDLAVQAATKLGLPLKVVGEGNSHFLTKYAGPTVEFVGKVSEEDLATYYRHSKALIFPGKEDFGLAMVEAQAAGKPVIAYKAGGALEIIKEGETGMFFSEQTVASLVEALQRFNEHDYNKQACKENAKRFDGSVFKKSLQEIIQSL